MTSCRGRRAEAGGNRQSPRRRKKTPIAIFISRKEKKIYVRQDFEPLFDEAVTIDQPDRPLGTHVFTAMEFPATTTRHCAGTSCRCPASRRKPSATPRDDRRSAKYRRGEDRAKRREARRTAAAGDAAAGARPHRNPAGRDRSHLANDRSRLLADRVGPGSRRGNRRGHRFYRRHALTPASPRCKVG